MQTPSEDGANNERSFNDKYRIKCKQDLSREKFVFQASFNPFLDNPENLYIFDLA